MKDFLSDLFGVGNKTIWLEWHSKPDAPNPWEAWQEGPDFEIAPTEKELMELYYQHKFNPEKQILDYKYKRHKGPIILDYRQIKVQDEEEYRQNLRKWKREQRRIYGLYGKRGLVIQIATHKKFKDGFLKEGWKIAREERWRITEETRKNSEVSLIANIVKEEGRLKIEYTLYNGLDYEIFIFNQLFQTDREGNRTLDPNYCYITVLDDKTVCISKQLIKIPKGLKVEAPEIPYLTRILPKEEIKESLILSLPLHIQHPYISPFIKDTKKAIMEKIKFVLSYIVPSEGKVWVKEAGIKNSKGEMLFMTDYGLGVKYQKFAEFGPIKMSIPVLLPQKRGRISGLEERKMLDKVMSIAEPDQNGRTYIEFQRSGRLWISTEDDAYVSWIDLLYECLEDGSPVCVIPNEETHEAESVFAPQVSPVFAMRDDLEGKCIWVTTISPTLYVLHKDHPRFVEMYNLLQQAMSSGQHAIIAVHPGGKIIHEVWLKDDKD